MKIGVPSGLLYTKYRVFAHTFLTELGAEIVPSPQTNRNILDLGIGGCADEACLPVKVFHGHVSWLRDRCDAVFLPRMIGLREREYICPMFCGLSEMVQNDIRGLPRLIGAPMKSACGGELTRWALETGSAVTRDRGKILTALETAKCRYGAEQTGYHDAGYPLQVGLLGHAYNLYDRFLNMDVKQKLNRLGVGVTTTEWMDKAAIARGAERLYKRPFWTFAREFYGAAAVLAEEGAADGIVYLSSFSCGIDSVVTELIKSGIGEMPLLILKLDEHTGEAGLDTRIEAFAELLKRRRAHGNRISQPRECRGCGGRAVRGAADSLCHAGEKQ